MSCKYAFFLDCLGSSLIKFGQRFGGSGGASFDDSVLVNFTYAHYLSGLIISNVDDIQACQFIYRSPYDNQSLILSPVHGNHGNPMESTYIYHFDDNERVDEVTVVSCNQTYGTPGGSSFTIPIVKRFRFKTTKGRLIPADIPPIDSDIRSESFSKHDLGYVTGKSGQSIDQLQFVWYRTKK